MDLGRLVIEMMNQFANRWPVISITTKIVPDNNDVYEIMVRLQKVPASFTNGDVELLKNEYAFKEFGEDTMVHIGVSDDQPYILFNFEESDYGTGA